MTSEQYTFAAQDQKFSVTVVRKKVKNINLHIRNDGNLLFPHRPVFPGPISRLSYKKRATLSAGPYRSCKNSRKSSLS